MNSKDTGGVPLLRVSPQMSLHDESDNKSWNYGTYEDEAHEYVNTTLPCGETVRFRRVWAGYRFTDIDVEGLVLGVEIKIDTAYARGLIGSLDWLEYKGYDFYGFAEWCAEAYNINNAPFPVQWGDYVFTSEDESLLRTGDKLLVVVKSKRTGSDYAIHLSYDLIEDNDEDGRSRVRWGIVPHFEEFDTPASEFTRETCPFMPMFGGCKFTQEQIKQLRYGAKLKFRGVSKKGNGYTCVLELKLCTDYNRWRLMPNF